MQLFMPPPPTTPLLQCITPPPPPSPPPPPPPPAYHVPEPVYPPPRPVYHAPKPVYHKPKPVYHAPKPAYHEKEYPPEPYTYEYAVADDYSQTNFRAGETSDGNVVSGSYSVQLPDGRIQHVKYTADHYNGYQAEVTYEGTAHYPEEKPL